MVRRFDLRSFSRPLTGLRTVTGGENSLIVLESDLELLKKRSIVQTLRIEYTEPLVTGIKQIIKKMSAGLSINSFCPQIVLSIYFCRNYVRNQTPGLNHNLLKTE